MALFGLANGVVDWPTKIRPWCGEPKAAVLDVAYLKEEDTLTATINGVWEDDLYVDEFIQFLLSNKIIEGCWSIAKVEDTEGYTFIEDQYTTITLKRVS